MSAIRPHSKPRSQPFFELLDLVGRAIAAQHDLFLRIVERIKRVEELVLGAFFSREKLHVIDQEHVDAAVRSRKSMSDRSAPR
jgi:hypothetical protein